MLVVLEGLIMCFWLLLICVAFFFNGVNGFWDGFKQLLCIFMIMNLFDRFFIDEWWVGCTKAWIIPGTEDLIPYITAKVRVRKWVGSCVGFPVLAAIILGIMQLLG